MSRRLHHHIAHRHARAAARHGRRRGGRAALAVARRMPPPVLVIGGVAALGGLTVLVTVLAVIIMTVTPVLVFGGLVALVVRHKVRRSVHRRRRARAVVPTQAHVLPARPDVAWQRARQRFATVRAEYAAYECDAMNVLRLPALGDVSVPSTARFVDAFAQAQALETDGLPPAAHAAEFVAATDRAARSWRAACDAAERIRLSGLSAAERSSVERAIKLLTTARDSDSDAERLAAYSLARTELAKLEKAGVVHLPRTARAALDAAARGQLPA
ncbi:MAG: hypothetical protein ACT4RN_07365 [Pseudonocardia sp.]